MHIPKKRESAPAITSTVVVFATCVAVFVLIDLIAWQINNAEISDIRYSEVSRIAEHPESLASTKQLILDAMEDDKITNKEYGDIYNEYIKELDKIKPVKQKIRAALPEQTTN